MSAPTPQEIARVIAGYERAKEASNYADTIVCEMQLVEDENYRTVWSTAYNGPFVPD